MNDRFHVGELRLVMDEIRSNSNMLLLPRPGRCCHNDRRRAISGPLHTHDWQPLKNEVLPTSNGLRSGLG